MTNDDNSEAIQRGCWFRQEVKGNQPHCALCGGAQLCTEWCVNTRTKTHPLKPLTCASVMLLKSAKMAHPPSCIQSFLSTWFILSFSPAVTSRKHDRQIWTELIGLNISVVGILIWWIVTRKADSWSGKQIGKNLESTELCSLRAPLCL